MTTPLSPADCRQKLRRAMPVVEQAAYFDHAAVAPLTAPAAEKLRYYADQVAQRGDLVWPEFAAEIEAGRQTAAAMLNAAPDEVAWIANTTQGINFVAGGLDWSSGQNIVTLSNEFPSNLLPWLQLGDLGVETRLVDPDARGAWTVESILDACDQRTRLIAISWVGFASGYRGPIQALTDEAHRRGILVFLDAIQGLGVFPLNVRDTAVDFLAADGHKWMLGPEGAGLFYVSREALNCLRPMNVGWNSVVTRYNFDQPRLELRPCAARYEGGTQNVPGVTAFAASLELLTACGHGPRTSVVGEAVLENVAQLAEQLRRRQADVCQSSEETASGILSFTMPHRDSQAVRDHCVKRNVAISFRGGRLRASPHAYCNQDDIDRLLDAIDEC
ncbi:MAG: aminotransferase class V-fold PLP-dependent enzyme [Planctomycetales bacterium]|nr:aminotransferase class V-fold PLP-dependent enzyme [Planctomycetales bacterium]